MIRFDVSLLIREAISARENAYAPYSNFKVGAALVAESGEIFRGCNIENAAFSPTNCAERTAFFSAVAAGKREFTAIAVAGWAADGSPNWAFPCGVCRQVMMEFCDPERFVVIIAVDEENYRMVTLRELLPDGFGPDNLS